MSDQEKNETKEKVDNDPTPGPADYFPSIRWHSKYPSAPQWSFTNRRSSYCDWRYNHLGPGRYSVSSLNTTTKRAPAYTFGSRHSRKKLHVITDRD